jgi:hypothetical protein
MVLDPLDNGLNALGVPRSRDVPHPAATRLAHTKGAPGQHTPSVKTSRHSQNRARTKLTIRARPVRVGVGDRPLSTLSILRAKREHHWS